MARVARITDRNGVVLYRRENASYREALESYIAEGGTLSGLDHSGKNLAGLILPELSDLSGSDFTGTVLNDTRMVRCKLENCVFYKTKMNGMSATRAKFDHSEFFDCQVNYATLKFVDMKFTKIVDTNFFRIRGYRMDFESAEIENSNIRDSNISLANFVDAYAVNVDFEGSAFVPGDFAAGRGRHQISEIIRNKDTKKMKFIEWINSLYSGAKFVGCRYDDALIPPVKKFPTDYVNFRSKKYINNFPNDYRYQRYARTAANIGVTVSAYVALESINHLVEEFIRSDFLRSSLVERVAPYLDKLHPGTVGLIAAGTVFSLGLFGDEGKDMVREYIRRSVLAGWRAATIAKETVVDSLRDMANLTILVGSKAALKPIRSALVASSLCWESSGRKGAKVWRYRRRFLDVMLDRGRILMCSRQHLEHALEILAHLRGESHEHLHRRVTLVSHHDDPDRPAAFSILPSRFCRAVWSVEDPEYTGHLTVSWDSHGKREHFGTVPPLDEKAAEDLLARHPEIDTLVRSGPTACLESMLEPVRAKQWPGLFGRLREAAENKLPLGVSMADDAAEADPEDQDADTTAPATTAAVADTMSL